MPFALGYKDCVPTSVVSGGGWLPELPLSNIKTDDLEEVARSASLDPADTQFVIDTGAVPNVGMIVLKVPNASPNLQYRIRSFSDVGLTQMAFDSTLLQIESGTSVDWSDSSTWLAWEDPNFWTGIVPSEYGDLPLYIVSTIPAVDSAKGQNRYWLTELFDETNSDGHLDVASEMLLRIFRPEYNYAPDSNLFQPKFLKDTEESKGGRRTHNEIAIRRVSRFNWPMISEEEAFGQFARIGLLSRDSRPVFLLPEETDTGDRLRLRAFPATLNESPPIAQLNVALGSTSIDAEEVL